MIELSSRAASGSARDIKILGIGGGGANALDRLALDGVNPAYLIAANTDALALKASVAGTKLQLGAIATRGLGCGGDAELGRESALETSGEIRAVLEGVQCVFLLAGLGGGTGSGAAAILAEIACDCGAMVIAVVTLPFAFEKRRVLQAREALEALRRHANAVVCFENDCMADMVSPKSGIQQAFMAADQTISQSVQAIWALLSRDGLIHLGFDDFRAALTTSGGSSPRCLFGFGEADGGNRPYDALARAFKNPLMDRGRLLRECETVLVQVAGGPDLTLNEVQLLMEEFNRYVHDSTRVLFGAAVEPALAGRLTVTVIGSLGASGAVGIQTQAVEARQVIEPQAAPAPIYVPESESTAEPEAVFEPEAASTSPLREIAEREARRIAALDSASETESATVVEIPVPEAVDEAAAAVNAAPPEWEYAAGEEESEQAEPSVIPDDEFGDEVGETEAEATAEPIVDPVEAVTPVPRTPSRRRPLDDNQASLFGDESRPRTLASKLGADTASPRIARPIPGRTLQAGGVRMPMRGAAPDAAKSESVQPVAPAETEEPAQMEPPIEAQVISSAPDAVSVPDPVPDAIPTPAPLVPAAAFTPSPSPARPAPPRPPVIPAPPINIPGGKTPLQETLQFEPVSRGRFDKSEPTIVDGQDLDVPTFLRRNVRVR